MQVNFNTACIPENSTIREAMIAIDRGGIQLALVLDADRRLIATVTDGDIRRGLLSGLNIEASISHVMNRQPIAVSASAGRAAARLMMREKRLHHVPLIDSERRIVDLAWVDEIIGLEPNKTRIVLMAGGLGKRLRPLTDSVPKPMLQVGNRPLIEVMIQNLIDQGFSRFTLAVNYLSEMIEQHFGDGSQLGVEIEYIHEKERMGTAGALSLMHQWPDSPFVVMNGDLLTSLRFEQMLRFHVEEKSLATMGTREFSMQVPYGVIQTENDRLVGIEEKPNQSFHVNAGIYILSPSIVDLIETGVPLDMPDLFLRALRRGEVTTVYPIRDYWIDIGRSEDLDRARTEFQTVFG